MTLQIANVCNEIAAISVTGVDIRDIDEIKEELGGRDTPCLMPKPDGFITDFNVERDSFGAAATARKTVTYTLNYTYLHAPLGEGRGLFDVYDQMVVKSFAILDAIIAKDSAIVAELVPVDALAYGPVVDPAGEAYHGCIISVHVTEFVN